MIEEAKARERLATSTGGANPQPRLNSDEAGMDDGRADDKTAAKLGVGRDTLRKEISIVDNKDFLTPEEFAEWDESKLSTNKAYQLIKQRKAEAEWTRLNVGKLLFIALIYVT